MKALLTAAVLAVGLMGASATSADAYPYHHGWNHHHRCVSWGWRHHHDRWCRRWSW